LKFRRRQLFLIVGTLQFSFIGYFSCTNNVCFAEEEYKIPAAPVVLLITEAKKQRKTIWTKEIHCVADVENTVRDYIEGITHDCRLHKKYFTASTEHWLQKLLAPNETVHGNQKRYWTLATDQTLVPRMKLIKFAGKSGMEKIDSCLESIPPPVHSNSKHWIPKPGDWDPSPTSPGKSDPGSITGPRDVSQMHIFELRKHS